MQPLFADLLCVTSGAESFAHGLDPFYCNPFDPEGRCLNYPRIWQWLGAFGVQSAHTMPLSLCLIALYLVTVVFTVPIISFPQALWVFVCLISPASLFAVERGNADMLIFVILALALACVRWWPVSLLLIYLAFVLKLFPFAAAGLFFRYHPRRALFCLITITCAALAYLFIIRNDLPLISAATPRGASQSYGMHVFWTQVSNFNASLGLCTKILAYLSICVVTSAAVIMPLLITSPVSSVGSELDAFRIGAGVFCGTFLLGNNWDYRLIFLLFVVPQIVSWLRYPHSAVRRLARAAFIALLLSLWHFLITRLARPLPFGVYVSSTLDELANWILFASLLFLFSLSLPAWVLEPLRRRLRPLLYRVTPPISPAT